MALIGEFTRMFLIGKIMYLAENNSARVVSRGRCAPTAHS